MTCLCCGKPGERAAWSDSCPNTYVCVDCKSLPARFEKLQRDANESNRILGDQCERAEAEVAILRNDLATYAERIAALEAERDDAEHRVDELQVEWNVQIQANIQLSAVIAALEDVLHSSRMILGNMAAENKDAIINRWPIKHEPLRADARNLLPLIDKVLYGE